MSKLFRSIIAAALIAGASSLVAERPGTGSGYGPCRGDNRGPCGHHC